jgi:hypothetical protein
MITDLSSESLYYITRGAKWSVVKKVLFSSSKCEKRKSAETYKPSAQQTFD